MIKTRELHYEVPIFEGSLQILNGINLEIKTGESLAIVGASGSGKSTLLGMLAGLDVPSGGDIFFEEQEITRLSEEQRAQMRSKFVAFVFQNFQLLPSLTALENVLLPLEIKGADKAVDKANDYLARVGLAARKTHYPSQLSGGEQQRVALARAFACEAPIIFADEPTGNLDTETGKKIADLLFSLNKESGTTLVLVTHSESLATRCERKVEMRAGELMEI